MKRILSILLSCLFAAACSVVFLNHLFLDRAKERVGNFDRKLSLLHKADSFVPYNDQVYFEMGKTLYFRGVEDLSDLERRDIDLVNAIEYLHKAIRLNPGYYLAHYYLAQALLYKSYFSPEKLDYMSEYLKTSVLNSYDESIYFDVGKILLTQWAELDEQTKRRAVQLLKRRSHFKDENKTWMILQTWAAMSLDIDLMDKVLPRNSSTYKMYAQFLGEREISIPERKRKLAEAEFMDFQYAKDLFRQASGSYQRFRLKEAKDRMNEALRVLLGIRFYQDLIEKQWIEEEDYLSALRNIRYYLLRISIDMKNDVEEIRSNFLAYLHLETDPSSIEDLEFYLIQKKFMEDDPNLELRDLNGLFYHTAVDFKLKRFRQILTTGENLKQSIVLLNDENKGILHYIYKKVAESYRRLDYLYDARDFFERSLEIIPDDTESLFGLLLIAQRQNDEAGISSISQRILNVLSLKEITLADNIAKGEKYELYLVLDGSEIFLDLRFSKMLPSSLISVCFNDRIIWEDIPDESRLRLRIQTNPGANKLSVVPVNNPVFLHGLVYEIANPGEE